MQPDRQTNANKVREAYEAYFAFLQAKRGGVSTGLAFFDSVVADSKNLSDVALRMAIAEVFQS